MLKEHGDRMDPADKKAVEDVSARLEKAREESPDDVEALEALAEELSAKLNTAGSKLHASGGAAASSDSAESGTASEGKGGSKQDEEKVINSDYEEVK